MTGFEMSIIIPTYNRMNELAELFHSIINQSIEPIEVIIVDDSDNNGIEYLVQEMTGVFRSKDIDLKYVRNNKGKSLTIARNIGVQHAAGDIILFLDDDVVLEHNYLESLLLVYRNNYNVLGVQGFIMNNQATSFLRLQFNKLFLIGRYVKNECKILTSTNVTYPSVLDNLIQCQWLSGANQSFKRSIFNEFQYDEKLKRYSLKEDVDFSYRIYKKYPESLFITPDARLVHKTSNIGRLPNQKVIMMKYVYSFYLFYKNISQTSLNKLMFYWSWVGYSLLALPFSSIFRFISGSEYAIQYFKYALEGLLLCLLNLKKIKKGNLDFFDQFID